MNPLERIYAAFPAFLYLNASLGGALLSPLLPSHPDNFSGQTYAAQDIGGLYPQVQGPNRIPQEGVERKCPCTVTVHPVGRELTRWLRLRSFGRIWKHAHHDVCACENVR